MAESSITFKVSIAWWFTWVYAPLFRGVLSLWLWVNPDFEPCLI